MCQPEAVP
jgi:hypothetical protein